MVMAVAVAVNAVLVVVLAAGCVVVGVSVLAADMCNKSGSHPFASDGQRRVYDTEVWYDNPPALHSHAHTCVHPL